MPAKPVKKVPITVAQGDGIGPEIMDATLAILSAAGAQLDPEFVTLGEKAFKAGIMNGVPPEAFASIQRTGIILKAPITTPQGGGYKSVNVTLRKTLDMFANVRTVRTFEPFVRSKHNKVDMVIVRENAEDLYAGIEYRQTLNTCHSVKFVSRTGTEMIIRYAFELARVQKRKKVTALVKDNIMKITDGLFHKTFVQVGAEYPDIEKEVLIVDIGMARVADTPERFDVVVTLNLYGDIVSDIASQISGSVGLAGSVNVGQKYAMYEAVHGSAPDIAGQGVANPSGLLNAAILMLESIGQTDVATKIGNAWLRTIEDGLHTGDFALDMSKAVGTKAFSEAVIARLGQKPTKLPAFLTQSDDKLVMPEPIKTRRTHRVKRLLGVDIYVDWPETDPQVLGKKVEQAGTARLSLFGISLRGLLMYPKSSGSMAVTDHWRCRFTGQEGEVTQADIRRVLASFESLGLSWTKVENLFTFDGEPGFSLMQGE